MKELRKIPNEKLGCRKCEIFGGIYAVTATETDGNMEKKKKKGQAAGPYLHVSATRRNKKASFRHEISRFCNIKTR